MNTRIIQLIESNPRYTTVCDHPYLRSFACGEFDLEYLRNGWLPQQAWLSRSFPMTMAALLAKIPPHYYSEARALVEIVNAEVWGLNSTQNHPSLFKQLHRQIGACWSLDILPEALPSTIRFVETRQRYVIESGLFGTLGCLIANEYVNANFNGTAGIMVCYNRGLETVMEISLEAYTNAHVREEADDVRLMLKILSKLVDDLDNAESLEAHMKEVEHGIDHLLEARVGFLDGLAEAVHH